MRILYDPESEPGLGSATPDSTPAAAPASTPGGDAGFSPGEFTPEVSGATPSQSAPAAPSGGIPAQPQPSATDWIGVRDFARSRGVDLSQYGDDEAALNHLMGIAQRERESAMYSQLGRQLAPHADQIQQYLRNQQQAPQQAQQPDYMPPPLDDRYLSMVEMDPQTGLAYGKPGTPAAIVDAVNKRITWQKDFNNNPIRFFDQHVQSQVPTLIEKAVQQQMAQYQQQQTVDTILRDNAAWLYARDQSGNMLRGPQGYVPTPQGQRYIQHVQTLSRAGVSDPRIQDQIARQLTFGEIAMGQAQQPPGPAQAQTRQATGSPNRNAGQVNRIAGANGQEGTTDTLPEGLSLYEYMKRELDAAGVTDSDFAFEG
jgi:hypothetical protein